ncbi:hypothetical protein HFN89_05855 [Rhizobium laguerreae]|nr:hypothetical protein [Rhizobium laguerreae]
MIVGLSSDRSKVMASPEAHRLRGTSLIKAGIKTYNEVGMISGLDIDMPSHHRLRGAIGDLSAVRRALTDLRREVADVVGSEIVARNDLPPEFRIVNAALNYKASNKLDHARLVLRWPWLYQAFADHPDILDRSVNGESLWDLVPEEYDGDLVQAMKRLKGFNSSWVSGGLTTKLYIRKLVDACAYIPVGGQKPTEGAHAKSLIDIVDFFDGSFGDFPAQVREMLKSSAIAKGDNWRGEHQTFPFRYARDYVSYLYRNIILDGFRLMRVENAPSARLFAAAEAVFGNDPRRIAEASDRWHDLQNDWFYMDRVFGYGGETEATSWKSAIGVIRVPNGLTIVPLDTAEELAREGQEQRHCVYSQRRDCAEGRQRVASVRRITNGKTETLSTFSFKRSDVGISIREHRAFANRTPADEAIEAVMWFEDECNGATPAFRIDTDWPAALSVSTDVGLRDILLERFENCKTTLPKKLQKGGLDALLAECVA